MKAKSLSEIDILKGQTVAQKSMEPEMIYRDNADKNNKTEEMAPSEKTVKVQENEDVFGENMGDKNHPEFKQNEIDAITESMDGAPLSAELLDIDKSLDKGIVKKDDPEAPHQAVTSEKAVLNENKSIYFDHVQENSSEKKSVLDDQPPKDAIKRTVSVPLNTNNPEYGREKKEGAPESSVEKEAPEKADKAVKSVQTDTKYLEGIHEKNAEIKGKREFWQPDINKIIQGAFLKLQSASEKTIGLNLEKKAPAVFSPLPEWPRKSNIRLDRTEAGTQYDKPPEKEENAVSEMIKEQNKKNTEPDVEMSSIGIPLDESLFLKDLKIEVLVRNDEDSGIFISLLKNPYLSLRKRHTWGDEKKVQFFIITETERENDTEREVKKVFSVAKIDSGIYTFVMENRVAAPYKTDVLFVFYERQKHARMKEYKDVIVSPFSKTLFRFVLPDALFWDDKDRFTGSFEDSDSITKFNNETGFLWREEKDY